MNRVASRINVYERRTTLREAFFFACAFRKYRKAARKIWIERRKVLTHSWKGNIILQRAESTQAKGKGADLEEEGKWEGKGGDKEVTRYAVMDLINSWVN